MSGNPSSNVVPMPINPVAAPTNWPGPMFMPRSWGAPGGSPSCFSELASLNACYDSVQMMEQILSKVVCDLAQNNAAFQQCLVNAIAASGSNVPLIGVTNGQAAQPGQVGEFISYEVALTLPVSSSPQIQVTNVGTLPPGDWLLWAIGAPATEVDVLLCNLNPTPAGFSTGLWGGIFGTTMNGIVLVTGPCHALTSTPVPLVFDINSQSTVSQSCAFYVQGVRQR
jgi:hypothetical protein